MVAVLVAVVVVVAAVVAADATVVVAVVTAWEEVADAAEATLAVVAHQLLACLRLRTFSAWPFLLPSVSKSDLNMIPLVSNTLLQLSSVVRLAYLQ